MNDPAAAPPPVPRVVLILKLDTLGDLVLFAPALRVLRAAWPEARLSVLIRNAYRDIAPWLAPGVEWLTTAIDPFGQGPNAAAAEWAQVKDSVVESAPDLVIAATSRRNWLELALAAAAPAWARRVALGSAQDDPYFGSQLRLHHGLDAAEVFNEIVATPDREPDWKRNFRLADALLGRPIARVAPSLTVDAPAAAAAAAILRQLGLTSGQYAVGGAAGFANVAIKTWPAANFGAALRHLRERHGLPALLVGQEHERTQLETVRERAGGGALWLGREGELPLLAALIGQAAIFFGNDTGAMHLAAALDVPVVAVFGGGTWPRFVPAARRSVSLVQPLPCFGCGWDCAFGDAPCVKGITVDDATAALDFAVARRAGDFAEVREVEHLPAGTRELMGAAATRYRALQRDHLARQHKIEEQECAVEEKESAINEKEKEIAALKAVCDEREKLIVTLHGHAHALTAQLAAAKSDHALLAQTLAALPADAAASARALNDQAVHLRNLASMLQAREVELAEFKGVAANRTAGLHDLEQAKHYGRLLAEKETVIRSLSRACRERESVIRQLAADATTPTAGARKLWIAAGAHAREKWWRPFDHWLFKQVVEDYGMQIGVLRHHEPRPLRWDARLPRPRLPDARLPRVGIVTPSYRQEKFIGRTLESVLAQAYPKLFYVVQDGGSPDGSAAIIARHAAGLHHWESVKDQGQADAIRRGFARLDAALEPDDVMGYLNSDDVLAPGALRFVAEYFATHPAVDVIYGHRIIIDESDRELGRWIMPRHNPATLEWIDYVPQETLFWRKRSWDLVGGIDPSFHFALDWDLLARFQQAGARVVRLPYFLAAFRVHAEQKTSHAIDTTGADEMRRIRTRFHGERQDDFETIDRYARHTRFWGAITARLHAVGIRW